MPTIRLSRVSKRFTRDIAPAVDDLDLVIEDGSFTTLLGPSGCGKTTTLRMIAGLEQPTGGDITIGDQTVFSFAKAIQVPPAKRGLGLVFQSYALWPHLTVFENIAFGLSVARTSKKELTERVEAVAAALQIDELLGRFTSELSGGQQQRVAIARVLVMRPSVLLLDEPLSNLDAMLRMDMRAELKRLHTETGATVIYVTHDQIEALTMSTHIALMRGGTVQQFAPPLELYAQPINRFAADFVGHPRINFVDGAVEAHGAGVRVRSGSLAVEANGLGLRAGDSVALGLRPEELHLAAEPIDGDAEVEILAALPTGADWFYRVRLGSEALTVRDDEHPDLAPGDRRWLRARPQPLKVYRPDGTLIGVTADGPAT